MRFVQIMIEADDDSAVLVTYAVPKDWEPPVDWDQMASTYVPKVDPVAALREANRMGIVIADADGGIFGAQE